MPLIPQEKLAWCTQPDCETLYRVRAEAEKYIKVFRHCQRCPALFGAAIAKVPLVLFYRFAYNIQGGAYGIFPRAGIVPRCGSEFFRGLDMTMPILSDVESG